MHLALHTTFVASRKEPLADMLVRVHTAIVAAGLGEPEVQFTFADGATAGGVASLDRVLKRFPQFLPFDRRRAAFAGGPEMRALSNIAASGITEAGVDFSTLLEVARGVPRSFPFHHVSVHFSVAAFSRGAAVPEIRSGLKPGINVTDAWWVSGRERSLTALTIVDAEAAARKLPAIPADMAAVFAGCGKVKKTIQMPLAIGAAARPTLETASPEVARTIRAVVEDYRARIGEVVERARLPHDLPPNQEAAASAPPGVTAGPKKPELVRAFTPMGYDCHGGSGTFSIRRRTDGNLTVELLVDVGTWSNMVLPIFRVQGLADGLGFKATLTLPVTWRAVVGGQYPMGGPERWRQIVDNLAALVGELDRSFVVEVEAAAGPSPVWYRPEGAAGGAE